ncbi:hypothetical protein [Brevibacterium aurantiacum]|uniref:hypothetical protein n=1 Tax=Brevibacterium aurantiacum TaxID=273384 RepID=UPI003F915566
MNTDMYNDEPSSLETKLTLGNRGKDLGVWVESSRTDDRVFIPLGELKKVEYSLYALKDAVAALRNIGIGLSTPEFSPQFLNGGGQELDSSCDLGDSFIRLVRLDESSPFDCTLGSALGTADSFVNAHDSSPSVGTSTTSSTCGCGDPNTTEGEVLEAARNAEAAAKRAEVAALFAVDAGNSAAWVAAGGRDSKKPRPTPKPAYGGGDSDPAEGQTSDSARHCNIEPGAVADADEFLRAFDASERRRDILGGGL